ncbi:FAD-binding domain-containing protein, partial [Crucibulum laeve]
MVHFESFLKSFRGDISTPSDADYAEATSRWALNAQRNAKIVAFPMDAQDVALATDYAKKSGLPLAIRGGGHSTSGASSSENGLVIDLSRYLKEVTVDVDNKLAYVGGGALWGQVDKAAIEYGLATVGGTVNHTGVGGLTLGGGVGWLSGMHGLVIDNLVEATVVTADGSILTASEVENPDLFFGIRGGGCNFGVVTRFVLKLHPQRRTVWTGEIIFPATILDQLISLTDRWWSCGLCEKEGMLQMFTRPPQNPNPCIVLILFYNGTEPEGRENFKDFFDLKPFMDLTREVPYEMLNSIQNEHLGHGQCRLIKGVFQIKLHAESIRQAMERMIAHCNDEHNSVLLLEFFSLAKAQSVPNGDCAFVRGPGGNVMSVTTWKNDTAENLAYARTTAREVTGLIATGQEEFLGVSNEGYGNY